MSLSTAIHTLWADIDPNASELQVQAHRLMLQILFRARKRLPFVLADPKSEKWQRIIDSCIPVALKIEADGALRLAALELLQNRVKAAFPDAKVRLIVPPKKHDHGLSLRFGEGLESLKKFEAAVHQFALSNRSRWAPSTARSIETGNCDGLTLPQSIGLLVALLVLRQGHACPHLLAATIERMHEGLCIAGRWAWIDVVLSKGGAGSAQLRRVFLDPHCVAAWRVAVRTGALIAPDSPDAGVRRRHFRSEVRRCFSEFASLLKKQSESTPALTLKELCAAKRDWLHVNSMPLLGTYATGGLASSSLTQDTWLRLIGFANDPAGTSERSASVDREAALAALASYSAAEDLDSSTTDRLFAGDLDGLGIVAELRRILSFPREQWREYLEDLAQAQRTSDGHPTTAYMIISWLRAQACTRRSGGAHRSVGTIRHLRGLIINRLLVALPDQLGSVDGDSLTELYEVVIESGRSTAQKARILSALCNFDAYVRREHLPALPEVTLPGFPGAGYTVSSRVLTEGEYEKALGLCIDGTVHFRDSMASARCRAYLVLAFRLGLRRGEILGLQVGDLRWGSESLLHIRANPLRGLKTNNGLRLLPLSALTAQERAILRVLTDSRSSEDFLFFDSPPTPKDLEAPPVVAKMTDVLFRVSSDPALHGHNLRHSFATWAVFGMLGLDLGIDVHPYAEAWMRRTVNSAGRLHRDLSGSLHRLAGRGSAVGTALGHGSEITSFHHYIHCLDLLLFFATNRAQHDEMNGADVARDQFRRNEVALITALSGLAATSRLPADNVPELLQYLLRDVDAAFHAFTPLTTSTDERDVVTDPLPELSSLLANPLVGSVPGAPSEQSELDSAIAFLQLLSGGSSESRAPMFEAFRLWSDYAFKSGLWASLPSDKAALFLELWGRAFPDVAPEVMHVYMPPGTRANTQTRLAPNKVGRALKRKSGKFWIRLPDPKPAGRPKPGAIGWVIRALTKIMLAESEGATNPSPADLESES